ncbi:hypothetical protein [Sporocytophaga myxococcoides]|uniref:hypothetical protein n=1 Tax=Sporocytophaga myxococcoides TaxID=153721 RepID=UPI0006863A15|nr:hypothetical protein [Sporocytophaga myxococcoides]
MKKPFIALSMAFMFTSIASKAQVATNMVLDIENGSTGSSPSSIVNINGTVYFMVNNNTELWKSNGTANGTVMLKNGFTPTIDAPKLVNFKGTLLFYCSH